MGDMRFLVGHKGVVGKVKVKPGLSTEGKQWYGRVATDYGQCLTMVPGGKASVVFPGELSKSELIGMLLDVVPEYEI